MQVVILCGGKGMRLREVTDKTPKPLIEVGGKPIIHHLMELYATAGHTDFILCTGYKAEQIEGYFANVREWNITCVNTGIDTNKAERIMQVQDLIKEDAFLVSYGDDLSDVDINAVIELHKEKGSIVTLTAVNLESPFGILDINQEDRVTQFKEKPKLDRYMNGGFYVFSKEIFKYLQQGKDLEKETFEKLAAAGKIAAYKHTGFWKSMNTLKDVTELNEMHDAGKVPWVKK